MKDARRFCIRTPLPRRPQLFLVYGVVLDRCDLGQSFSGPTHGFPLQRNAYSSSFNYLRGATSIFSHPPMLLPDNSPQVIHPPMSLPEESPMDFLHPPMLPHEDEALFSAHTPLVSLNSLQLQHNAPAMSAGMELLKPHLRSGLPT